MPPHHPARHNADGATVARRGGGAPRQLDRRVDRAVAAPVPAPVGLGRRVHRLRLGADRAGTRRAGARVDPRPASGRTGGCRTSSSTPAWPRTPTSPVLRSGRATAPSGRATSGLTQPPLHARAALATGDDAFLRRVFPALAAQHRYLAERRDVGGGGLAAIVHPWESGMDDSPAWDEPLAAVALPPGGVAPYERRDRRHVDPSERPSDAAYDRFVHLARTYRDAGYADEADQPFLVEDPLFNAIWLWSTHALAEIADRIGEDPAPFRDGATAIHDGLMARLWDPERSRFLPLDLRAAGASTAAPSARSRRCSTPTCRDRSRAPWPTSSPRPTSAAPRGSASPPTTCWRPTPTRGATGAARSGPTSTGCSRAGWSSTGSATEAGALDAHRRAARRGRRLPRVLRSRHGGGARRGPVLLDRAVVLAG